MACAATVSWLIRACRGLHSHDHTALVIHEVVVVVTQASRRSAFGGVGGIGIGGGHLILCMHRFFYRVLLFQLLQTLADHMLDLCRFH
jgi:hypothetical protein